jgi:hypothetical protein
MGKFAAADCCVNAVALYADRSLALLAAEEQQLPICSFAIVRIERENKILAPICRLIHMIFFLKDQCRKSIKFYWAAD